MCLVVWEINKMDERLFKLLNEYFEDGFDNLKDGEDCNHLYEIWERAEKGYNDENQMKEDAQFILKHRNVHSYLAILLLKSYKLKTLKKNGPEKYFPAIDKSMNAADQKTYSVP